uniref:Secreted protein n=1 Tax=Cacopsylla melanoneura TaxID=428564 RepID=A0A8D9EG95_9HEMI
MVCLVLLCLQFTRKMATEHSTSIHSPQPESSLSTPRSCKTRPLLLQATMSLRCWDPVVPTHKRLQSLLMRRLEFCSTHKSTRMEWDVGTHTNTPMSILQTPMTW